LSALKCAFTTYRRLRLRVLDKQLNVKRILDSQTHDRTHDAVHSHVLRRENSNKRVMGARLRIPCQAQTTFSVGKLHNVARCCARRLPDSEERMSSTDYGSLASPSAGLFGIKAKGSKPTRTSTSPSLSLLMPTSSTSSSSAAKNNFGKSGRQRAQR
jgi:hypothetical protein